MTSLGGVANKVLGAIKIIASLFVMYKLFSMLGIIPSIRFGGPSIEEVQEAKASAEEAKARAEEAKSRAEEAKARAEEAKARADAAQRAADARQSELDALAM